MPATRTLSPLPRANALAAIRPCCAVCGSVEVAVDEVWERGLWRLSECRRCENQWTDGPFGGPRGPVARVVPARRTSHAEAA